MLTIFIFLIVLAILIFVHELGHFLAARACGIRVDAFKIGFGPKVFAWKRGGTEYGLNLIPFGGYVKIFGEDPNDENTNGPDKERSFVHKARWKQVIVLVAGVTFNFIFAMILYAGLFMVGSNVPINAFTDYSKYISDEHVIVVDVQKDSPAEHAGIKIGDVFQTITSAGIKSEIKNSDDVSHIVNSSEGSAIHIQFVSNRKDGEIDVTPITGLVSGKYAIGVSMDRVGYIKMPVLTAIWESPKLTFIMIKDTVNGLYGFIGGLFHRTAGFEDVTGPVGIALIVKNAMELGFAYLVIVTALISINLGVINLVPFPALDGGRTLFVVIEGIARRRIPAKFTNVVNATGFILLMILMVIVTYRDVVRLVK